MYDPGGWGGRKEKYKGKKQVVFVVSKFVLLIKWGLEGQTVISDFTSQNQLDKAVYTCVVVCVWL
jgi:hypothetical protein